MTSTSLYKTHTQVGDTAVLTLTGITLIVLFEIESTKFMSSNTASGTGEIGSEEIY